MELQFREWQDLLTLIPTIRVIFAENDEFKWAVTIDWLAWSIGFSVRK